MPLPWQHTFYHCQKMCLAHLHQRQTSVPNLFFTNSHEIWHRCLPWGVDVQDTFFDSGRKCVAMVTAYYGKNGGKILRRELLPQFFTNSHEIWHRCLPWGVDVQDTFFDSGRKCVAMVTAYYDKNGGKNLASRTTSSVFHQFSWNLAEMFALECRCARHIFRQWQKECCHGNGILWQKWGENLASRTTSSHENWWKTEEVVRDARFFPPFLS